MARKKPAPRQGNRPSPNATNYSECNATGRLHGHDRHEPLDVEDRADLAVLEAAAERGFVLATRCVDCGHFVVNEKSVRLHRGPVCRAKAVSA